MKNIFLILLFSISTFSFMNAQNTTTQPTEEDYERLLKAAEELEFREYAITSLDLTREQIIKFDPLYREYLQAKSKLAQKKFNLLDQYVDEIQEDDSFKNEQEDKEEFIENYWEVEIAEMELKKDYFDVMADKIGADNAFGFFLLEDNAENRVQKKIIERRYVPIYIEVEKGNNSTGNINKPHEKDIMKQPIDAKYKSDVAAFSNWVLNSKDKVGLDHQYTHDGLISFVNAIVSLSKACQIEDENFHQMRQQILQYADKLQEDRYSDKHADYASEAFAMSAKMLRTVQKRGDFSTANYNVAKVEKAANKIDIDELLTPQSKHIYDFFLKAQMAVNSIANSVSWASN